MNDCQINYTIVVLIASGMYKGNHLGIFSQTCSRPNTTSPLEMYQFQRQYPSLKFPNQQTVSSP